MELPSKILKQIAFNTRPKIEERMLLVMDKATHEEHLAQPSQNNIGKSKSPLPFSVVNMVFSSLQK